VQGKKKIEFDPRFRRVDDAFAATRGVTSGILMSSYGLKVNGKIFAMFGRGKFVVKLPKHRVDELVSAGMGDRFAPGHGRSMKEWLAMRGGAPMWVGLAREAYEFVNRGKKNVRRRPAQTSTGYPTRI
jgi:hypothetical protein